MSTVLLVILLIISVIMTGLILIQRSEGGALGIGGGGGGTGFMSGRAAGTSIARMTAILGTIFLVLSLLLSVVYALENRNQSAIDSEGDVAPLTTTVDSTDTTIPLDDAAPVDAEPTADPAVEAADPTDTDE